jgi:hypothetical protein
MRVESGLNYTGAITEKLVSKERIIVDIEVPVEQREPECFFDRVGHFPMEGPVDHPVLRILQSGDRVRFNEIPKDDPRYNPREIDWDITKIED